MKIAYLLTPEDSRFDVPGGIDVSFRAETKSVLKAVFWITATIVIIAALAYLG